MSLTMASSSKEPAAGRSKTVKLTGPEQVALFLKELEHPLKDEIEEVRKIILSAADDITEQIKWNAPSFCYNRQDRVTMNLQGKGCFRLIFHTGVKVKEAAATEPLFTDTSGLLEWITGDRAVVKITDNTDLELKRAKLAALVARWMKETVQS
ncbi:DUF1801 domain-containing protein [Paenibacillus sp. FSL H8-0259]|uniref:DUF1801 domain-containing protein n=2 Tax=Paenibacillus TaxID=44249 RepID=UPI002115D4CA|nr:DUF1801 domain-containing protein [Paenibacillus sp. FSL H8-0259]